MGSSDLFKIALIIAGLVSFAALLYLSRRQAKRLEERKKRMRDHVYRDQHDEL